MNAADIKTLKDLSKHDATVALHFKSIDNGVSFESMVVNLAIQLAKEKADTRRQLRNVIKGKESPTIFGLGLNTESETP